MWDPNQYLAFADHRARPWYELLARVPVRAPSTVVDLGCGPGNLTRTLAERWPGATVVGVDSSREMIERAVADGGSEGRLTFVHGDLRRWQPETKVDVIVSNAALHWVPGHLDLLGELAGWLAEDGWLAIQVPGNFEQPSHRILAELRAASRWADAIGDARGENNHSHSPSTYATRLLEIGLDRVDAWETTYVQLLRGDDPVYAWVEGTALRPMLAVLAGDELVAFTAEYRRRLRQAYPALPGSDITPFPFRRVFAVAHRSTPATTAAAGGSRRPAG